MIELGFILKSQGRVQNILEILHRLYVSVMWRMAIKQKL